MREHLLNYLVDCHGYDEKFDLQHLTISELKALVIDWFEFEAYTGVEL